MCPCGRAGPETSQAASGRVLPPGQETSPTVLRRPHLELYPRFWASQNQKDTDMLW